MRKSLPRASVFFLHPENLAFARKKIDRPVLKESARALLWFWALLFVASLIGFAIILVPMWKEWYDFEFNGVSVEGELDDYSPIPGKDDKHVYSYSFFSEGEWHEGHQEVDDKYNRYLLDHQRQLPVRYVKGHPEKSRLDSPIPDEGYTMRAVATVVGLVCLAFTGLLAALALDSRERVTELVDKGRLVKGKVVSFTYKEVDSAARAGAQGATAVAFGCVGALIFALFESLLTDKQSADGNTIKNAKLTLRYEFTSPESGKTITKTERITCKEFDRSSVPIPGIPVAVLYASDKKYRVL